MPALTYESCDLTWQGQRDQYEYALWIAGHELIVAMNNAYGEHVISWYRSPASPDREIDGF